MSHAPDPLLTRITGEFREMPGLRLTLGQASRFLQIERTACEAALNCLVERAVLRRTIDGAYVGLPPSQRRLERGGTA